MPLTALPVNYTARNDCLEQLPEAPPKSSLRTATPNGSRAESVLNHPSSIQSMLRNTTETGNLGQFYAKTAQGSPSTPNASPSLPARARAAPYSHRHPGGYYHLRGENNSSITATEYQGISHPNSSIAIHVSHQKSNRGPFRGSSIEDYAPTQNSSITYSPANHHAYSNGSITPSRGTITHARPRSPFAYPTRLKRPGYRPSSPALSDLGRKMPGTFPAADQGFETRNISPASMYSMHRGMPWPQKVNRSDPMLRYYPSSQGRGPGRLGIPSPSSSQPSTPRPTRSLRSVASTSYLSRVVSTPDGVWARPHSPSPSPLFYDYTEAFEEQSYVQRDNAITEAFTTPPMLEGSVDVYFATKDYGYRPRMVELASENTAINTEDSEPQEWDAGAPGRHSKFSATNGRAGRASPRNQEDRKLSADPTPPRRTSFTAKEAAVPAQEDSLACPDLAIDLIDEPLSKQITPPPEPQSDHRSEILGDTLKPHDVANERSTSPTTSTYSTEPTSRSNRRNDSPRSLRPTLSLSTSSHGRARTPVVEVISHGMARETMSTPPVMSSRDPSFEGLSRSDQTGIFAPTPERSITSPSSRDRFSKILSIDDNFVDPLETASRSRKDDKRTSKSDCLRFEDLPSGSSVQSNDSNTVPATAVEQFEDGAKDLLNRLPYHVDTTAENAADLDSFSAPISLVSRRVNREIPRSPVMRRSPATNGAFQSTSDRSSASSVGAARGKSIMAPNQLTDLTRATQHVGKFCLPPKNQPAFRSFLPPHESRVASLPFAFTPLIQRTSEDDSVVEVEVATSTRIGQGVSDKDQANSTTSSERAHSDSSSATSPTISRPWNLDTSYPWIKGQPKIDTTTPQPVDDVSQPIGKFPRFKLKIQRASSSTDGTAKIINQHSPLDENSVSPRTSAHDFFQATIFNRRPKPNLSVAPTQNNSSHGAVRTSPLQTRFVESFENISRPQPSNVSPTITLLPPSPGPEIRSFFSDDSSQARPKGGLRKRFSEFRIRTSRASSTDDPRGYDRGLLSSALGLSRASGRSSRQSQTTAHPSSYISQGEQLRWNMVERIRHWLHRSGDKVRDWGWRVRHRGENGSASANIYAGV